MWGLTQDGTFASSADAATDLRSAIKAKLGFRKEDIYRTVMLDLQKVRSALSLEIKRYQFSVVSDAERGRRLLFLFQKDLLPGVNAMILESKGKRDFVADVHKVERYQKALAWGFILMLNTTLLFYIYLFAIQQSSDRQEAWFVTFLIWLILEVCLMSTFVVFVTHFLIPSIVMQDLKKVKRRLLQTIRDYKKNIAREGLAKTKSEFNVADYFFVSSRLSTLYPDLVESKIIQKFTSPWPHQSYLRTRSISKSYSKRFSTLVRSVSMIAIFFLRSFLSMPPSLQDALMQLTSVVVTGNVFSALVSLYRINPILPAIPIIVVLVISHFLMKLLCHSLGAGKPDSVAVSKSSPFASGRKIAVVSQPTAMPGHVANVPTDSPSPTDPIVLKTRRQSVQHGIKIMRAMETHHQAQLSKTIPDRPILGVFFDDISDASGNDDIPVIHEPEVTRNVNNVVEPVVQIREDVIAQPSIYDVELSDDEEDVERLKIARARGARSFGGARTGFVNQTDLSLWSDLDAPEDKMDSIVHMKDLFAMDVSDDSDEFTDRGFPLELTDSLREGFTAYDVANDYAISTSDEEIYRIAEQLSAKSEPPQIRNMTMVQLLSTEVSSESSDYSDQ